MDVHKTRRERVAALVREEHKGLQASFADRIGKPANYVSRMLSSPSAAGHKNIGEEMARHIEKCHDKPAGWLDGQVTVTAKATPVLFGMQISAEGVHLGREWEKLDEPMRSTIQALIEMLVAAQVRKQSEKKPTKPSKARRDLAVTDP